MSTSAQIACRTLIVALAASLCGACEDAVVADAAWCAWVRPLHPSYEAARDGARRREHDSRSATPLIDIEDDASLSAAVDTAVSLGAQAIALPTWGATDVAEASERAASAGLAVVTWGPDGAGGGAPHVGADSAAIGRRAARMLSQLLGGTGEIAVLEVEPGGGPLLAAFEAELASSAITIVARPRCAPAIDACEVAIEETTLAHPELAGWFVGTSIPFLGRMSAMPTWVTRARAGALRTVVIDVSPPVLSLFDRRMIHGAIGPRPQALGYAVVDALRRITAGMQPDHPPVGFDVVCSENHAQIAAMWATNNFDALEVPSCALGN